MTDDRGIVGEWHDLFHREFSGESDRASVILSSAMLEEALETILRTHLVAVSGADDSLFDGNNAPIGHFASKIDLAYRLGLIPANFARDLHLIRRIRNRFAHDVVGCTFDTPAVISRVTELVRRQGVVESMPEKRETYPGGHRGDFQMTVSWMLWVLWYIADLTVPLEAKQELSVRKLEAERKARKQLESKED